jgi:fluoride ion exporter CrcB/FEX
MSYFEQGHWLIMIVNILGNNLLALSAVVAGMALARAI